MKVADVEIHPLSAPYIRPNVPADHPSSDIRVCGGVDVGGAIFKHPPASEPIESVFRFGDALAIPSNLTGLGLSITPELLPR